MSKQRDRIWRMAVKFGYKIIRLEWEPIGKGAEKEGPSGGWLLEVEALRKPERHEIIMAYHHKEICQQIRNYAQRGIALDDASIAKVKEDREWFGIEAKKNGKRMRGGDAERT